MTHANYDCTYLLDASLIWAGQSCVKTLWASPSTSVSLGMCPPLSFCPVAGRVGHSDEEGG